MFQDMIGWLIEEMIDSLIVDCLTDQLIAIIFTFCIGIP